MDRTRTRSHHKHTNFLAYPSPIRRDVNLIGLYLGLMALGIVLHGAGRVIQQRHSGNDYHHDKRSLSQEENDHQEEDSLYDEEGRFMMLSSFHRQNKQRRVNPLMDSWAKESWGNQERTSKKQLAQQQHQGKQGWFYNYIRRDEHNVVIGDRSSRYQNILKEYEDRFPPTKEHDALRREWVKTLRKHTYEPIEDTSAPQGRRTQFDNDLDCPYEPDVLDYPRTYKTIDILEHWNPDNVTRPLDHKVYQGICIFDYNKPGDLEKAYNYRRAEVPFVIRDDPTVLRSVERWNDPDYLPKVLHNERHRSEYSHSNHFMYWQPPDDPKRLRHNNKRRRRIQGEPGWKPPTEMITMTYDEWLSKVNGTVTSTSTNVDEDHWYFRLIGCGGFENCDKFQSEWLFDDLDFFYPRKSLYITEPSEQRGIHCRFGQTGVIAENHFDASRNMIALLKGERRYILSHPNECPNLELYPVGHPSARHSAVDWSNPDLEKFPDFAYAKSNEIVLQAGDVMYLPTNWFHYIISLELNMQCNTRSGISSEYIPPIEQCGFPLRSPRVMT